MSCMFVVLFVVLEGFVLLFCVVCVYYSCFAYTCKSLTTLVKTKEFKHSCFCLTNKSKQFMEIPYYRKKFFTNE